MAGESLGIREERLRDWLSSCKISVWQSAGVEWFKKYCWKKIKGRESHLGLNVQTQADGHITDLASWACSQGMRLRAGELFSCILAWKGWCRGEVFTVSVGVRGPCPWEVCWESLLAVEPVSRVGGIHKKECVQFQSKYCVTLNKLFVLTCASVLQLRWKNSSSEKHCKAKTLWWLFSDTALWDTGESLDLLAWTEHHGVIR